MSLYGLDELALSVARTDPKTGEKINKMRKSYENQIKKMQISGKPKAVKMERVFEEQVYWPEANWHAERVSGREIERALDADTQDLTSDFSSVLDSAFAGMAPGPLPSADAARYRAYLGTDDASKPKAAATEAVQSRGIPAARSATPNAANSSFTSRGSRPERSGAKRSYTDVSFQGYGEGFTDDGGDDGQNGVNKRRRLGGFERTSHSVEVGGPRR
jgi:hypothetical protein